MPYEATVYKVMIASPSDVAIERNLIREVLAEWNVIHSQGREVVLLSVGWETHSSPEMGSAPQEIINKQILKDSYLLVGVFWTRLGTATDNHPSGSVEEIEEHIKMGKPTMLYFSAAPVKQDSVDETQWNSLRIFKESCKSRGLFAEYHDVNDFKNQFFRHLQIKLNQEAFFQEIEVPDLVGIFNRGFSSAPEESAVPDIPYLTPEASSLLLEAAQDSQGRLKCIPVVRGLVVQANGRNFAEENSPRERAIWMAAIKELEHLGLISPIGYQGHMFTVTKFGYEIADLIRTKG
jgi:hypothetical protein